jgi:hypothetical protein
MRKYIEKQINKKEEVLITIGCDVCKKTIDISDNLSMSDMIFKQEMKSFSFYGGYGSKFGDMNEVKFDICDKCFYDMIGDYCQINGEYLGEVQNV